MKIKQLRLIKYNQFNDLTIDLTYPKGHAKEGQPLEKICFIGQGGTGKTSILRLIKWFVSLDRQIGKNIFMPFEDTERVEIDFVLGKLEYTLFHALGLNRDTLGISSYKLDDTPIVTGVFFDQFDILKKSITPLIINFPTEIVYDNNPLENDEIKDETTLVERTNQKIDFLQKLNPQQVVDFALEDVSKSWEFVLKEISEYRAKDLLLDKKLGDTIRSFGINSEEVVEQEQENNAWRKSNANPIEELAQKCLNVVLKPLGLKVKTSIDINTILHINYIELQTLSGKDVPRTFWSTGTKQLINTLIPLFELKPKNAIILMDEPERSLYPDLQRNIIDTYVSLGEDCQFFFATHSPIIASSFDPWEIVELKFNNDHEWIIQDPYFENERHVNNYKFNPKFMRWDTILTKVFDLDADGREERQEKIKKLAVLSNRIKKRIKEKKNEFSTSNTEPKKLEDLAEIEDVNDFKKLANELQWEIGDSAL
ncbi:MAG: ATP-binding protein [Cytophagales bacterium]